MKYIGLLTLLTSFSALAQQCKVFGISDSPQTLACTFPRGVKMVLTCEKGKYFFDRKPVEMAFHAEVEEGACPLIFKLKKSTLTVIQEKSIYAAELETENGHILGRCF